jgi:hypothetical protein
MYLDGCGLGESLFADLTHDIVRKTTLSKVGDGIGSILAALENGDLPFKSVLFNLGNNISLLILLC